MHCQQCLSLTVLFYGARGGIAEVLVFWCLQDDVQLLQRLATWTHNAEL